MGKGPVVSDQERGPVVSLVIPDVKRELALAYGAPAVRARGEVMVIDAAGGAGSGLEPLHACAPVVRKRQ